MIHSPELTATQRELDLELLGRLAANARPVALLALFGGLFPTWAVEALDRLMIAGHVHELADDRLELTATGRALVAA